MNKSNDVLAVEFIGGEEAIRSAEIRENWLAWIATSSNLRVALQTPHWIEYRWQPIQKLSLCVTYNSNMSINGASAIFDGYYPLEFKIGKRSLFKLSVNSALLIGNAPIAPETPESYAAFFNSLERRRCVNSIYMLGIPIESRFWKFIEEMQRMRHSPWLFYQPEPHHRYHTINMPASFEEYLRKFNSKERNDLKRKVTVLQNRGGQLELERITESDQLVDFLRHARFIAENSWQKTFVGYDLDSPEDRLGVLTAMSESGMHRSYLLKCGGDPCAYVLGFQLNGVFYFYETAYHNQWSHHSPGRAILYLLIQDLFVHDPPKTFYFGPGDVGYKRWFATGGGEEVTLLILKKTIFNRLKISTHFCFRSVVRGLKGLRLRQTASKDR